MPNTARNVRHVHLNIVPHILHLHNGARFRKGCSWCEMVAGKKLLRSVKHEVRQDALWYEEAQKSGKLAIDF